MTAETDPERVVAVVREPVSGIDVGVALVSTVTRPVVGTITVTRGIVSRVAGLAEPLVDVLVLHPPVVPSRLQPGSVLVRLSRRGRRERTALLLQLDLLVDAMVPRVTDELLRRLDLDAVVTRVDVAQLAQKVIAEVDLPEIIRESTGAVSSEAVREVRMRGIAGDETVGRAVDRLLLRHRRAAAAEARARVPIEPEGSAGDAPLPAGGTPS